MAVAAIHETGTIVGREILPTEAALGFDRAVQRLIEAITRVLAHGRTKRPLVGIGIGCAGPLDSQRGWINNPYTLTGWDRCDIVRPLRERFGVGVFLENDADAAALGECAYGAGKGFDPVVMLTFGTGIGGAAVVRSEIYRGVRGEHPEIGHVPVRPEGPECYCGIRGCLESTASGTAIAAAGKEAGFASGPAVFAAARLGQPEAQRIIDRALDASASAAWTICHTFLPERLVLGGGIMDEHFDLFAGVIRKRLALGTQFTPAAVSVAHAVLGNDAGIVGAGAIAFRRA